MRIKINTLLPLGSLLLVACGTQQKSDLAASVGAVLEEKWRDDIDLSRELAPELADQLSATRASVSTIEIGRNLPPILQFGDANQFKTEPNTQFNDIFESKVLTQISITRARDMDGTGDGLGLFLDVDTVAENRYVRCTAQKVITEGQGYEKIKTEDKSFLGMGLVKEEVSRQDLKASTDYILQRGYYLTKRPVKIARLLELCGDIAKADVGLQQLNTISEAIRLNFNRENELLDLAQKVSEGKKVNDFAFHNGKYDFKILRRENNALTFEIFPDTHWADPKIESRVNYRMEGSMMVIDSVEQKCVSNCQNYHNSEKKHGIKSYGEHLSQAQSDRYIKLLSMIFAAKATNSR